MDIEGTCSLLDFYCTVVSVCFDFVFQHVLGSVDCLKVVVVGHCYKAVLDSIGLCLFWCYLCWDCLIVRSYLCMLFPV